MSQLNCSFRLGVMRIVMRSFRAPSFCHDLWIWAYHLVSCQRWCPCWSISVSPDIFRTVPFPFILYSYILFFKDFQGFFRGFPGLAEFSLPLHLECCLRVSWSVRFCSPAICFSPAYRSWDFTDMWQCRPMSYKFGLVNHHTLDRFLHKPVFGIENYVFPGFCVIVSLWFCFGHINWCMSHDQSDSGCCHLGNQG